MAIHALEQKTAQARARARASPAEKPIDGPHECARTPAALLTPLSASLLRELLDHVADHAVDEAAGRFVDQTGVLDAGVKPVDLGEDRTDELHGRDIGDREQPGAQAVVDIVVVIGDVVGQGGDLRLGAGPARKLEIVARDVFGDRSRASRRSIGPLCLTVPSSVSQVRLSPSNPA